MDCWCTSVIRWRTKTMPSGPCALPWGSPRPCSTCPAYRATGIKLGLPYFLALLAEAYGKTGQVEKGLAEGMAVVDRTAQRGLEAALYRLKGQLTLQQFKVQSSKFKVDNPQSAFRNPQSEDEACFLKAIEVARKQQAKS